MYVMRKMKDIELVGEDVVEVEKEYENEDIKEIEGEKIEMYYMGIMGERKERR